MRQRNNRLMADQWHKLGPDAQRRWDLFTDDEKAVILSPRPPRRPPESRLRPRNNNPVQAHQLLTNTESHNNPVLAHQHVLDTTTSVAPTLLSTDASGFSDTPATISTLTAEVQAYLSAQRDLHPADPVRMMGNPPPDKKNGTQEEPPLETVLNGHRY